MLPTAVLPIASHDTASVAPRAALPESRRTCADFGQVLAGQQTSADETAETQTFPAAADVAGTDPASPDPEGGKDLPDPAPVVLALPVPAPVPGPVPASVSDQPPAQSAPGASPAMPPPAAGSAALDGQAGEPNPPLPAAPAGRNAVLLSVPALPAAPLPLAAAMQPLREPDQPARAPTLFSLLAESGPASRTGGPGAELSLASMAEPPASPVAAAQVTGGGVNPAALPIAAPAAAPGPQDFAQLIDRLLAARDAAQPHSVTMALNHADFGAVELRFHQDGAGLAVAMTSADPDFTRAVQAAMPTASSSNDGQAGLGRQPGFGSGQADQHSGQQSGQSQTAGRGHDHSRRDAPTAPQQHPVDRGAAAAPRQHGIFA